jgi:hypothetical protein
MSDTDNSSATPAPAAVAVPAAPPPRNIYLTVLTILVGIVLLLPGLCSLAVGAYSIYVSNLVLILGYSVPIALGLLVGFGGIMLIRSAIRGPGVSVAAAGMPPGNIYLTALMVLVGIILLLPGLCSLAVGAFSIFASDLTLLSRYAWPFALGLLAGLGGIMVIYAVLLGPGVNSLTVLMIIAGIILLLPGLCSLVVGAYSIFASELMLVARYAWPFAIGLLAGFGGIILIRAALRGRRR